MTQFYTTTPMLVPDGYTLMTAARPLPGEQIGRRDGSGFGVYLIGDTYRAQADRLDAHEILVVGPEWEEACLEATRYADAYRKYAGDRGEDLNVRQVIAETTMFRHTRVELVGEAS